MIRCVFICCLAVLFFRLGSAAASRQNLVEEGASPPLSRETIVETVQITFREAFQPERAAAYLEEVLPRLRTAVNAATETVLDRSNTEKLWNAAMQGLNKIRTGIAEKIVPVFWIDNVVSYMRSIY